MTVRASADPDEMPPARTRNSNVLRQAPFNAPFEPALLVFDLMKSTPLVDSGGPTTVMIYLSQEQVGTVPHIRNGLIFLTKLWTTVRRPRFSLERLTKDPIVRFPICGVAPAGSGLESPPVKNRDIAAAVMDQTALLQ
jgi:hypothetical protein